MLLRVQGQRVQSPQALTHLRRCCSSIRCDKAENPTPHRLSPSNYDFRGRARAANKLPIDSSRGRVYDARFLNTTRKERMAKQKKRRTTKTVTRRRWSREDNRELRAHSKARSPVAKIARLMKRSAGALRQQAMKLGIRLGHRR
jgi:hypothetical protein